jgi:hypothetical protein
MSALGKWMLVLGEPTENTVKRYFFHPACFKAAIGDWPEVCSNGHCGGEKE